MSESEDSDDEMKIVNSRNEAVMKQVSMTLLGLSGIIHMREGVCINLTHIICCYVVLML